METVEFWDLIEASSRQAPDPKVRAECLVTQLAERPVREIAAFEGLLREQSRTAMTWRMWGAAHRILGGCSEDSFIEFRAWLVGLGRDGFHTAVADPDALAGLPQVRGLAGRGKRDWADEERPSWEPLVYVASEAYEHVTAADVCEFYDLVPTHAGEVMADERWDFGDPEESARRLPRLTALFPGEKR